MVAIPTTLPASWYCNKEVHALERRAVFLRSWYFLGTVTKFQSEEEVQFEIAQVAFTVRNDGESLKVFEDSTGEELQSHQTATGLVFSAISSAAPSFGEFFPGLEDLLKSYDFTRLPLRRSIRYEGRYNWKTLIDGFQECLHCQYTHVEFCKLYPATFYQVVSHQNWSRHFSDPDQTADGLFLHFFPICTLNLYNGGMSSFRVCPGSQPGVSRMEFDYYHESTGEEFDEYYKFVRLVADEDFELCERAQANLEKGIYTKGRLNPSKEAGVVDYQQRVFEMVKAEHLRDTAQSERE